MRGPAATLARSIATGRGVTPSTFSPSVTVAPTGDDSIVRVKAASTGVAATPEAVLVEVAVPAVVAVVDELRARAQYAPPPTTQKSRRPTTPRIAGAREGRAVCIEGIVDAAIGRGVSCET